MCDPETGNIEPTCIKDCEAAFKNCGNDEGDCADPRAFRNISEDDTAASCDSLF